VTASGDKLFGGPQAGLLLGRADLIEQLRRFPAARALRVDKLTLAALEATLTGPAPPVIASMELPISALLQRAQRLADRLARQGIEAFAIASSCAIGGGAAPGVTLPSAAVSLPAGYAVRLRLGRPPVVGRVEDGRCLLDLRTVDPAADETVAAAVVAAATPT
jgi:L-seryl-tRNA(Ser) seleniumtransferase